MADPQNFDELRQRLYVRWANRPRAGAFLRAFSAQRDQLVTRFRDAAKVNFPALCDDTALDAAASSRNLERVPGESSASLRNYLSGTWQIWPTAGTRGRLLAEISRVGCPNSQIWGYRELVKAGAPPTVFGGFSSFFFVLIKPPHVFLPRNQWADGSKWSGGKKWGLNGDRLVLDNLKRQIKKWKPAGTSCRFLAIDLAGDASVPLWGNINWGQWLWGGISGTDVITIPTWEDWETDFNGALRREFYNYSYLKERI